jgi:hypothetical protein
MYDSTPVFQMPVSVSPNNYRKDTRTSQNIHLYISLEYMNTLLVLATTSRDDYPHFRLGPFTVLSGEAGIRPVL